MTRKRAAAGPPAAARQAETRAPPLGIADEVNLADSEELAKADSTLKTYKRFITGKRGWLEWTAGQAVPPLSLNVNAASIVAKYYFYRTEKLTLGEDLGGQLIAAISAYYDANTECGKDKWAAVVRVNETLFTSGSPANSSKVTTMKENHHKARVRAGTATPESVDVIEPLHVRAFFAANLRGRRLHECDPLAVMLHAGSMMGMSMLVRFNELTGLHTDHLGQSQVGGALHPTFSLGSTKNSFQRKVYDLVPWPTLLSLDPRYVPILIKLFLFLFSFLHRDCVCYLISPSHDHPDTFSLFFSFWHRDCVCFLISPSHANPDSCLVASLASWFWKTARTCLCWCWHPQI